MKNSLINRNDKPLWYENDRPIQEYLDSSKKPATQTEDHRPERLSWLKMTNIPGRTK